MNSHRRPKKNKLAPKLALYENDAKTGIFNRGLSSTMFYIEELEKGSYFLSIEVIVLDNPRLNMVVLV